MGSRDGEGVKRGESLEEEDWVYVRESEWMAEMKKG